MKKHKHVPSPQEVVDQTHRAAHRLGEAITDFVMRLEAAGENVSPLIALWAFENEAALLRKFLLQDGLPQGVLDEIRGQAEACAEDEPDASEHGHDDPSKQQKTADFDQN